MSEVNKNNNMMSSILDLIIDNTLNLMSLSVAKEKRKYDWNYLFKQIGLDDDKLKKVSYYDFKKEKYYNNYIFKISSAITVKDFEKKIENISYFLNVSVNDLRLEQIGNKVNLRVRNDIPMNFEYSSTKIKGFNIPLGIDIKTNRIVYHDLISPSNCHMLLGGSTGSGKSYLLKLILCNLIHSKSKRDLQLVLINTKYTDLKDFKDCKQVISYCEGTKGTLEVLEEQVEEIEKRYKLISKHNCEDIREYREKVAYIPYRFIILEEFSSYTKTNEGKTNNKFYRLVEEVVARGRACGVLLITTMQLSSSELVPPHIKNNINSTLGGKCKDKHKSITLCGDEGLEKLEGKGKFKLYDSKTDGVEFQSYKVEKDILKEIVEQNKRAVKVAPSTTLTDNKNIGE